MKVLKIRKKTPNEIVFASIDDMSAFYEEISSGKAVIFDYVDGDPRSGELINATIMSDVSDDKIKIRSSEGGK